MNDTWGQQLCAAAHMNHVPDAFCFARVRRIVSRFVSMRNRASVCLSISSAVASCGNGVRILNHSSAARVCRSSPSAMDRDAVSYVDTE